MKLEARNWKTDRSGNWLSGAGGTEGLAGGTDDLGSPATALKTNSKNPLGKPS